MEIMYERIGEVEERTVEIYNLKKRENYIKKERMNKQSLRNLEDSNKRLNISVTGVPGGEEKEVKLKQHSRK